MVNSKTNCGAIVDPGTASPVLKELERLNIKLSAILITHHHKDHTGGIAELLKHHNVPVYQPSNCNDGDSIAIAELGLKFQVIATPGHTLDHIVYYGDNKLFCGDTLFAGGCGRLFEGSATQMFHSLQKLKILNPSTKVYCAHEYTQANLKFAATVEPDNQDLTLRLAKVAKLRDNGAITLPSSIALELKTNPFLRVSQETIRQNVTQFCNQELIDELAVFSMLRKWKDRFG